jgi:hypothetical protein
MNDDFDNSWTDREILNRFTIRDLSADEVAGWGGFQVTADLISEIRGMPFNRQRVWSLHKWRAGNGFPQGRAVRLPDGRVKSCWWSKTDVAAWAASHKFRNSGDDQGALAS